MLKKKKIAVLSIVLIIVLLLSTICFDYMTNKRGLKDDEIFRFVSTFGAMDMTGEGHYYVLHKGGRLTLQRGRTRGTKTSPYMIISDGKRRKRKFKLKNLLLSAEPDFGDENLLRNPYLKDAGKETEKILSQSEFEKLTEIAEKIYENGFFMSCNCVVTDCQYSQMLYKDKLTPSYCSRCTPEGMEILFDELDKLIPTGMKNWGGA